MIKVTKIEHHSIDLHYNAEIDQDLLSEIYPDKDEDEIQQILDAIQSGDTLVDEIVNDAWEAGIDIEWEYDHDDMWTDRKGGYDITYDLGEE